MEVKTEKAYYCRHNIEEEHDALTDGSMHRLPNFTHSCKTQSVYSLDQPWLLQVSA